MGGITQALRNAQSGLLVNQQSLNTVANNISNVNTIGYSKKVVNFENVSVAGTPAGVKISEVTRQIDEGLLKSLRLESSELHAVSGKEDYFNRLQDLFGAPGDNTSISHLFEKLAEASELLALAPDKSLEAAEFVRGAVNVTIELQQMSETIQDLRLQADSEISSYVTEINEITANIDQLNDDIISNGTVGRDVTDLRDQRDGQIDRLAELVDIRYFFRNDGDAVVFTSGGRTIVDTIPPVITHVAAASMTPTSTHAEGNIGGIYVGTAIPANDMTDEIREGVLKALIEMRDQILPNLQSQIDELAVEMRDAVNQIHNQGVTFPGSQSMTGTRVFVDPATQTIQLDSTNNADDVTFAIFDANGNQTAVTTLKTILESAAYGSGAETANTASTVNEVAATIEDWLQENASSSATATINASGRFQIDLNSTSVNLAIVDQSATAGGSTIEPASIAYDSNGDGITDETESGFSYFFGLNDFFVDNSVGNLHESDVLEPSFRTTAATLSFRDSTGLLGGSTYSVTAGLSLTELVADITTNVTSVKATVVPDGAGFRLRFAHEDGVSMTVTQSNGDTFLTTVDMHIADVGVTQNLTVRPDIVSTPTTVATGQAKWDSEKGSSGEYFMSIADDTIAQMLSEKFSSKTTFDKSGGLPIVQNTFSEYAAGIVADAASLAGVNEREVTSQRALTEALQFKSDSVRGVNLDEEMADLIVFEQAFGAAARVISVIQEMMKTLERAIG